MNGCVLVIGTTGDKTIQIVDSTDKSDIWRLQIEKKEIIEPFRGKVEIWMDYWFSNELNERIKDIWIFDRRK